MGPNSDRQSIDVGTHAYALLPTEPLMAEKVRVVTGQAEAFEEGEVQSRARRFERFEHE